MIAGLEITSEERAGCHVLTAVGALDVVRARELEVALIRHASVEMPLVLDLSGVEFMDSSGLYVLLRTHHEFGQAGQRLIVVPSRIVMRLVEVAGVEHALTLRESVGDALTALGAEPAKPDASPRTGP